MAKNIKKEFASFPGVERVILHLQLKHLLKTRYKPNLTECSLFDNKFLYGLKQPKNSSNTY